MPKLQSDVIAVSEKIEVISSTGVEAHFEKTQRFSTLSWLCHHSGQIAKGSVALIGLAVLGGFGYLARGVFYDGRKTTDSNDAPAPVPKTRAMEADKFGVVVQESAGVMAWGLSPKHGSGGLIDFKNGTQAAAHGILNDDASIAIADGKIDFSDAAIEKDTSANFPVVASTDTAWAKRFGEAFGEVDLAHSVQQTTDGGYIVAGVRYTSIYTSTYNIKHRFPQPL